MTAVRKCVGVVLVALIWSTVWPMVAAAQEVPVQNPLEPSDTSSPAATLNSLIDSCNELDRLISDPSFNAAQAADLLPTTERILDCLDLSELPKELRDTAGIESALFLKEVVDRIVLPADKDIPAVDSQPNAESLLRWQIPSTRIAIARMEMGPYQNACASHSHFRCVTRTGSTTTNRDRWTLLIFPGRQGQRKRTVDDRTGALESVEWPGSERDYLNRIVKC